MSKEKEAILCVGLVCLDIVQVVETYPEEDSGQRCLESKWQRGGNASNSASVLSMLGERSEFMGTVASSPELSFLRDDFKLHNVDTSNLVICERAACPTAVVIINKRNGSRTILSTRNGLREMVYEDFLSVDLSSCKYKWIHFETRPNCLEVLRMMQRVLDYNATAGQNRIVMSIEFEKPRPHHDVLFDLADYVFISKDIAKLYGYTNMADAVEGMLCKCKPGATIICAWGEKGAAAKTSSGPTVVSPALHLDHVIDTLGAGDTFNAGTLYALTNGYGLHEAISIGCYVAGTKCSMRGLHGLVCVKDNIKKCVENIRAIK